VRPAGENLVLCPPYIVEPSHIDQMVSILADAIGRDADAHAVAVQAVKQSVGA
jgi:adenosylmethionine-8-amino-7-oxononanoate aminotransferase